MKMNKLLRGFSLLLVLMCAGCLGGIFVPTPTPLPTAAPRTIQGSTLDLEEQWRYLTGFPNSYNALRGMQVVDEKVVMASLIDPYKAGSDSWLFALSLANGHMLWQTRLKNPGTDTFIDDSVLDADARRLYLVYSFRIHGFDLENGKHLWSTPDLGGHTAYTFVPGATNPLQLRTGDERIAIDPDSGKVLSRQPNDESRMTLYHDSLVISNKDMVLTAVDRSSGQEVWTYSPWIAQFWPTIIGDKLLMQYAAGYTGRHYNLHLMNIYTADGIWWKEYEYVSKYALSGERVYILHQDGRLMAFDLKDGHLLGEIRFSPAPGLIGARPFWVAAQGPYVLVYFGDGQELIAFREKAP